MENEFLFYKEKDFTLYKGKMQDVLSTFEENSIDSIVCDPPYELNFMGKGWDNQGIAFKKDTWKHCFRVLKEGGYLLAFGGSRTFHRIACAIEDAGFEIRDTIMWLYGSGFPKSMNIGLAIDKKNGVDNRTRNIRNDDAYNEKHFSLKEEKTMQRNYEERQAQNEWQGWGTCLKPAYEPIIIARKPFKGSLVDNVIENGVGGINIDECRIPTSDDLARINKTDNGMFGVGNNNNNKAQQCKEQGIEYGGRFPANVILTYDDTDFDEVCGGMPDTKSNGGKTTMSDFSKYNGSMMNTINLKENPSRKDSNYIAPCDSGNASRYFYCAGASKKDRDEGLECFESKQLYYDDRRGNSFDIFVKRDENGKPLNASRKNIHPTVKPVELMQYLVRLVSPKGSKVLDCFMGSGSTGKACMFENGERNANYHFIGIEMTDEYLPIAKARIYYAKYKYQYDEIKEKEERKEKGIVNLFDLLEEGN